MFLRASFSIVLGLATLAVLPGEAAAEDKATQSAKTFNYVIKQGDTCAAIAKRLYGDSKRYDLIHQHNKGMGPTPHKLKKGDVLVLPVPQSKKPDAEVTSTYREVLAQETQKEKWKQASPGLDLFRGWRVNTRDRSQAEVEFQDGSLIQMRENTLVIIYGGKGKRAKKSKIGARLESGALRSRLTELEGKKSNVEISTPYVVAEGESEILVTVDDEKTSRVANHGKGDVQFRSKSRGGKVNVEPGMGSKAKPKARPSKPKPLPPAPLWKVPKKTFLMAKGSDSQVFGEWSPVKEATAYRVAIGRQPNGKDIVARVRVPKTTNRFEIDGLPAGTYYARVSTIDDDRFESIPSQNHALRIVEVDLVQEDVVKGSAEPKEMPGGPSRLRILPGSKINIPAEIHCRVGDQTVDSNYRFAEAGLHRLDCQDSEGQHVSAFDVEVAPITLSWGAEKKAYDISIVGDETVERQINLKSKLGVPKDLYAFPSEGIAVEKIESIESGSWKLSIKSTDPTPRAASVSVGFEEGNPATAFATIGIDVQAEPVVEKVEVAAKPAPKEPERDIMEMGLDIGLNLLPEDHQLMAQGIENPPFFERTSSSFTLRFAYLPRRWIGLEMQNMISPTQTSDGGAVFLFALRGQLMLQVPKRVSPYLALGGGVLGVSSAQSDLGNDIDPSGHFGIGVKYYFTPRVVGQIAVRDNLIPGNSNNVTHNLEATLGIGLVFGRHADKN